MPRTIEPDEICSAARTSGIYELSPDVHVAAAEGMAILELAERGQIAWSAPIGAAELRAGSPTAAIRVELR